MQMLIAQINFLNTLLKLNLPYHRGNESDKPHNRIPVGSTHNNIANGVFTDMVNKCIWNINIMDDYLLCNYLKIAKNTNISFKQADLKWILWMNTAGNNPH